MRIIGQSVIVGHLLARTILEELLMISYLNVFDNFRAYAITIQLLEVEIIALGILAIA